MKRADEFLATLAVLLLVCAGGTGCSRSKQPRETAPQASVTVTASAAAPPQRAFINGTLHTEDGRDRRYGVYLPKGYPSGPPRPLMLVLHGGGGNAEGVQRTTFTHASADEHGMIAVYPEGVTQHVLGKAMATWNGGYCCGEAAKQNVDDSAFLVALLDELKKTIQYDPERVFATGISNGGIMAMRLVCERPDRIAGISAVANPGYVEQCKDPKPRAVQLIHGTADGCALYAGGSACGGCWERAVEKWLKVPLPAREFPCTSVEDQAAFWRKVNGCSDEAKTTYDHGKARCREYSACASGKPVSVCVVDGGGHTWPGGELGCDPTKRGCRAFAEVTGPISHDLDANDAMVEFLMRASAHP